MRVLNRSLPQSDKEAAAGRICAAVEALPAFAQARCIACFCALPDEPPTAAMLQRWSAAHRVVVPRVEGERMHFCDFRAGMLHAGAFGIAEPDAAAALCDPAAIDLIVVPGVAFTADGMRLGRGRGFYDRYLAQSGMRAFRVGICFAHQLVDELPAEPHDIRMDAVCRG